MTDTANLALPFIAAAQAQKHVTHNEALRILDTLVQLTVLDRDLAAPPASPVEGQRWIVAASPVDAWAGHADDIAAWQDGAWQFSTPQTGWVAFVIDEGTLLVWNGSAWGDFFATVTAIQNLALLGVGTTADATNPFSAKLNKALWTAKTVAEGGIGDLRYTLNKEGAANVLSLLLQTAFSGRAELGLIGDDNLTLKVSPDGSNWLTALGVDRTSGGLTCIRSVNGGPLGGFRNMLLNGAFRIWQRGVGPFTLPSYTADRWGYATSGGAGSAVAMSQIAHPTIPGRFGWRFQLTTLGSLAAPRLVQNMEGVSKCEGQTVNVSFKYISNVAASADVGIQQNFGTGGSPSSAVIATNTVSYVNTGGALASMSTTVTVPSVVGKTLGTNGNDSLQLRIGLPLAICDFQVFEVQLEVGSVATPFEDYLHRTVAYDLDMCKRMFERIGGQIASHNFGKGYADSATHCLADLHYAEKRAVPTITINGGGANYQVQRQGAAVVAVTALAATAAHIGRKSCQFDATVASGLTAGEGLGLMSVNTSGYIDIVADV